jgi:hypothetical protein
VLSLTLLAILVAGGLYLYRRNALPAKEPRAELTNEDITRGWRELGFFCEMDAQKRVWTLTGSRAGLLHFSDLLRGYVLDPANASNGVRKHYGPYGSLEVMTWTEPGFDGHAIRGSLTDLDRLANLVETKLVVAEPGSRVKLREEFASASPYGLLLDVRVDGFDPASADPERLGAASQRNAPPK